MAGTQVLQDPSYGGGLTLAQRAKPIQLQVSTAAGSTGAASGSTVDLGDVYAVSYAVVTVSNATVTAGAVQLWGSIDGTNFYQIGGTLTLVQNTVNIISAAAPARYLFTKISTSVTGGATVGATVGATG